MPYLVKETSSGLKTLVYRGDRDIRIHSAFDPVTEASRAVESFSPGKKGFIVILGSGLGYHTAALRAKFPDRMLIVVEKDPEVIEIARRETPENISGTITITGVNDLSSVFEDIDISGFRGFSVFTHRPSYLLDPSFYDGIIVEMNRYASSKISDLLTRFEFEEKWAGNILENIPYLFGRNSSPAGTLFGAFRGCPGVIISAGPSLKKNARLLSKLSDKALLCCVDTSYKVAKRFGVNPHVVMTLDAQSHSIRHFLGNDESDEAESTVLLADLVSCPKIARSFSGMKFFSSTAKYYDDTDGKTRREPTPLMDWVELHLPQIGDIQSGGSVATSLFDFLLNAGCDPIILAGQDLAYTGREIHTSGTYHNDEWLTLTSRTLNLDTINQRVIRKRKIKYVPAWGGEETVITDYVLDLYRQWFEDSASKVDRKVINVTEGGARISGTVEMTLAEIADSLPVMKKNPRAIIRERFAAIPANIRTKFISGTDKTLESIKPLAGLPDNESSYSAALSILSRKETGLLLSPYLKKTNAYLNRHPDMPRERADALIAKDILRASRILSVQLARTLRHINELI